MTAIQLGKILHDNYEQSEKGEKVASIHLFGIKYGKIIEESNVKTKDIINISQLDSSYQTELSKGIKLGKLGANYINKNKIEEKSINTDKNLNQILYGPPGTGKTYNTINKALEIIDNEIPTSRDEAKQRFEELQKAGQIEFVTFHQSYGYEEFVEGIKAKTTDGKISYDVEGGVFKKLCQKAKINYEDNKKTSVQLEKEQSLKQKLELFLNDSLEIEKEFSKTKGGKFKIKDLSEESIIVFSQDSNYSDNNLELNINELYNVLDSDIKITTSRQMAKDIFGISNQRQKDTYYLAIYKEFKNYKFKNLEIIDEKSNILKNYIIIIDEINRGNISKIFGELITLIEPSKRIGADDVIKLRLPYSNDEFGVPSNLYIIGTMNTADRSIALMDTALRRRFDFVEMMPNYKILEKKVGLVANIDISKLLSKINERVEYLYDRDHTIGHAYFLSLPSTKEDRHVESSLDDLNSIFKNKIIPLLQEYFYDDWEKILLVLNSSFIEKSPQKFSDIFDENNDDYIEDDKFSYSVKDNFSKDSYMKIYAKIDTIKEEV